MSLCVLCGERAPSLRFGMLENRDQKKLKAPAYLARAAGAIRDTGPVSRILYGVAAAGDHSSRPSITERFKRPTRRLGAPSRHALMSFAGRQFPSYLVLLRVGFAVPRALLRGRCALTAPFHPYRSLAAEAVCSLLRFPSSGFEAAIPDVIRHTALRSSDFPLSSCGRQQSPGPISTLNSIDVHARKGRFNAEDRLSQVLCFFQGK